MSFSDPQPPPSFLPPPPFSGDGGCFWPQTHLSDDYQDSNPQQDFSLPPFKRPRNLEPNQPNNFTPFQPPMNNPRVMMNNPTPPPSNKGTGHIFFKTRMCLKFLDGNCRNGESCTFAHGAEDLREPPPNWQEMVAKDRGLGNWNDDQRLIHRMKICKKFYNGEECPYGEKCNFLHIDSGESPVIRIGTVGSGVGNRSGSDQVEVSRNLNLGCDGLRGNSSTMKPTCWKTKLCSKWEMTGHCPFGERCHFAHGFSGNDTRGAGVRGPCTAPNVPNNWPLQVPWMEKVSKNVWEKIPELFSYQKLFGCSNKN
ncbi:zinc finger CCCH domain-containing protein 39-like isoform X2 [Rhododendron vialii]|uniref:zinc finger CCCH domain-containing protein 39-like isoform X2 n=1 Tax=Rhododendron vialii TaxID=182163 RepID=UPI00265E4510|nr:zinc finger CCCH domain-containing protein 39-like isoform X2 [Rhododendron vialii]